MKLLGNYASNLNSFYYAELMSLISQSIDLGEFSGGAGFDTSDVSALQKQGQSFSTIALPSAGGRILDDNINQPLNLLAARFSALQQEVTDFNTRAANLITILEKDTALLDQLIASAAAESWAATQPQLGLSTQYAWDFSGGFGAISGDIPQTDPVTGVPKRARAVPICVLDTTTGLLSAGITSTRSTRTFDARDLAWSHASGGQTEEFSGDGWAEFSVLESLPALIFANQPTTSPDVSAYAEVTGTVQGGVVPVTVNLMFVPRRNSKVIQLAPGASVQLTPYNVQSNEVSVVLNGQTFQLDYNFTLTESGQLTSIDLPTGVELKVYFTEFFPAFQCSVNQTDWSATVMLDPARPYPDGTTDFLPIAIQNMPVDDPYGSRFPITDELGVATGLFLRLIGTLPAEQKFHVSTPASLAYGEQVSLTITLARPAYMTGLMLAPFASYPSILNSVIVNGVISENVKLFPLPGSAITSVPIDKSTLISFPRCAVRQLTLTFTQENYTLKEYSVDPPDKQRRDILASLQTVLPFSVRNTQSAIPTELQGALYEFGFEDIQGVDVTPLTPCVFVTGPYRVTGVPEVASLSLESVGQVDTYLSDICYSSVGQEVDMITDTPITPGTAIPVPLSATLNRTQVSYADFYVKFVMRSSDAIVERFFLQVSANV